MSHNALTSHMFILRELRLNTVDAVDGIDEQDQDEDEGNLFFCPVDTQFTRLVRQGKPTLRQYCIFPTTALVEIQVKNRILGEYGIGKTMRR